MGISEVRELAAKKKPAGIFAQMKKEPLAFNGVIHGMRTRAGI